MRQVTGRLPRVAALLDQADAAGRHGVRIIVQFAEMFGGELREGLPVGPRRGRRSLLRADRPPRVGCRLTVSASPRPEGRATR